MMFSNDYRPGRRINGYDTTRGDLSMNVITGDGVPVPVDKHRRRIEGGPSPELQKMNDQFFHLPAERELLVSPRRPAVREEKEPPKTKPMGKKVHGTARRESHTSRRCAPRQSRRSRSGGCGVRSLRLEDR